MAHLYGGLADLLDRGEYISFPQLLAHIEADLPVDSVCSYGTYMRVDPTKPAVHQLITKAQKAFFDSAKEVKKLTFCKGHFSGSGKEKGIDVHLAVDVAIGAATNQFDEAMLMTGDADLLYCVQIAKRFKKAVHLTAIGHPTVQALTNK